MYPEMFPNIIPIPALPFVALRSPAMIFLPQQSQQWFPFLCVRLPLVGLNQKNFRSKNNANLDLPRDLNEQIFTSNFTTR